MQQAVSLDIDGTVLRGMQHTPDEGVGPFPTVILFHGFTGHRGEAHRLFWKISKSLEQQGIASVRFDFAGSGESDGSFAEMTVSTELRDAHAILDFVRAQPQLDTQRVTVCGLSLGGLIASLLAAERPAEISRLILMAPAGNFAQIIEEIMAADERIAQLNVFDYGGHPVGREFAEEILRLQPYEAAYGFHGPVLLIHGSRDQRVPVSVSQRYAAEVYSGQSTCVVIEGANHTFDSTAWESQLMQAISRFLE